MKLSILRSVIYIAKPPSLWLELILFYLLEEFTVLREYMYFAVVGYEPPSLSKKKDVYHHYLLLYCSTASPPH